MVSLQVPLGKADLCLEMLYMYFRDFESPVPHPIPIHPKSQKATKKSCKKKGKGKEKGKQEKKTHGVGVHSRHQPAPIIPNTVSKMPLSIVCYI